MRLLTLLSDFGWASSYPAAMKAVVASQVAVRFLDITHAVERHNVRQGAFLLASIAPLCPAGTVHLAVVDPGVGTARRPLLLVAGGQAFVGPDNGLLVPAARRVGTLIAYHLDPRAGRPAPSATFHGRDLFAPVAARVLQGEPPGRLGRLIDDPVDLSFATGAWVDGVLTGEVLYVDPFGNLVTSIPEHLVDPGARFTLVTPTRPRPVRVRATYGAAAPGELILVGGSERLLEVAVREGSAAAETGLGSGSAIRLRPVDGDTDGRGGEQRTPP